MLIHSVVSRSLVTIIELRPLRSRNSWETSLLSSVAIRSSATKASRMGKSTVVRPPISASRESSRRLWRRVRSVSSTRVEHT